MGDNQTVALQKRRMRGTTSLDDIDASGSYGDGQGNEWMARHDGTAKENKEQF